MKKSVTITFFKNSGTKLGIQGYPLFGYQQNVQLFILKYDSIIDYIIVTYILKTCFSCVPKDPKCGYLLKGTIKFETKF